MMNRTVQPEWLDTLPADNAEAGRSRTDLRRINNWMGHRRILARVLQNTPLSSVNRILELGAGDGTLALALAKKLRPRLPAVEVTLVDQQKLVTAETLDEFQRIGWRTRVVQADVLDPDAMENGPVDVVLTNLFLHHFEETAMRRILRDAASRTSCFIALEPRRHVAAWMGCKLLWMIGCNRVTRHDARISVRAGFREEELSQCWPQTGGWNLYEKSAGLFSHLFVATRTQK
jgi:SAM-dependent methyltransferase